MTRTSIVSDLSRSDLSTTRYQLVIDGQSYPITGVRFLGFDRSTFPKTVTIQPRFRDYARWLLGLLTGYTQGWLDGYRKSWPYEHTIPNPLYRKPIFQSRSISFDSNDKRLFELLLPMVIPGTDLRGLRGRIDILHGTNECDSSIDVGGVVSDLDWSRDWKGDGKVTRFTCIVQLLSSTDDLEEAEAA